MKRRYLLTMLAVFVLGAGASIGWQGLHLQSVGPKVVLIHPTVLQSRPTIHVADAKLVAAVRTSINVFTRGTLDFVAEDGSMVHKGDKLISIDPQSAQDELDKAQLDLANEEANLRQAVMNRDDQVPRLTTDEKAQAAQVELAKLKLQRLIDLPDPLDWQSQEEAQRLTRDQFKAAQQDFENDSALYAAGYASQSDLKQKENALNKAGIALSGAGENTRVLLAGPQRSDVAQADLAYRRALLALVNLKLTQENTRETLEAAIAQEESNVRWDKDYIRRIQEDLEKHVVYAPHDGLVELVTRHGQTTKLSVGDNVWNGMCTMMLTDLHKMRVSGVMHENYVRMVTPGVTQATVTIPSNPGRKYKGVVSWIDRWAKDKGDVDDTEERKEIGMTGVRVFNFYVDILETDEGNLKPGRVAWVDIEPDQTGPVLALPRGAIIEREGQSYVRVVDGDQRELRPVAVLDLDDKQVQVISGIDATTTVEMKE
ncbi:MAG: HlyD family secretion protein [Planctomycetota bacterium]